MKKSILFVALVGALVLAFAASAYAIGPFYPTAYKNAIYTGAGNYLNWDTAATFPGSTGTSPHGGYAANTNKCAVCHSVHTAAPGKSVLTAGGPYATYSQGCVFCHNEGNTFTNVTMLAAADGYISPHGTCTRCHALNPHGLGTSEYVTLASKLINKNGDANIGTDLRAANNGVVVAQFDGTGTAAQLAVGSTVGTGYLCGSCHSQGYAVNVAGADPAGGGTFTGHRVTAMATASWTGATYGAAYTGNTVAYAGNGKCTGCHDAETTSGDTAFPHQYVDSTGALSYKTITGSSYIWLTTASDATRGDAALLGSAVDPGTGLENTNLLTEDGLCLKCHRSGTGSGVGLTF